MSDWEHREVVEAIEEGLADRLCRRCGYELDREGGCDFCGASWVTERPAPLKPSKQARRGPESGG